MCIVWLFLIGDAAAATDFKPADCGIVAAATVSTTTTSTTTTMLLVFPRCALGRVTMGMCSLVCDVKP
eukprot:2557375-Pyramimonas_sp.AAC.1